MPNFSLCASTSAMYSVMALVFTSSTQQTSCASRELKNTLKLIKIGPGVTACTSKILGHFEVCITGNLTC